MAKQNADPKGDLELFAGKIRVTWHQQVEIHPCGGEAAD